MLRGEIRLVDLGQVLPGESASQRPAVVVGNDGANSTAARLGRGVLTVAPMTSNVTRVYPFQVFIPAHESGLEHDSKVQAEQVRSVSVERVGRALGSVPASLMLRVDEALRLHLSP
ncbi:MAG: type II toxin-antitoxin system PemK/MazF family toxin [Acidimicrobiia bacterium]|jgi:mRNA interferase MazF